jgi:hypothetical protein
MSEPNERCAPFEEDLSAWIDGQLPAMRADEVRAHVARCGACTVRVAALRAVDAELRGAADAPRADEVARLAAVRRNVDAELRDGTRERPVARRAPRRTRRWWAPLAAGAVGAAASAALLLLVRPPAPSDEGVAERSERAVVAREPVAPLAAPVSPPETTLAAKQERDAAFARSGASAVGDGAQDAALEVESADELALIERMAALPDAERAELERDVARWRQMTEGERDAVRERWRIAVE